MEKKINLKISKTWSFNNKVAKVFDVHVNQSIPMYKEFHKQIAKICRNKEKLEEIKNFTD